jgi:NAD(P)-dependent dehydrogenase (short-subunit alcohol dehydrogenase family)
MSLKDQTVLVTGASIGIGAAIARRLATESATLILFARSADKLNAFALELKKSHEDLKVFTTSVDVQNYEALSEAVSNIVKEVGRIDVLINNAGLAIGAPNRFPDLKIQDIITMTGTNINGYMFATYAALNEGGMKERGKGTCFLRKAHSFWNSHQVQHRHNPQRDLHNRTGSPALPRRSRLPCQQSLPGSLLQCPAHGARRHGYQSPVSQAWRCGYQLPRGPVRCL